MTIKEFYDWAVQNDVENAEIHIQYRDGCGGRDWGYDDLLRFEIQIEENGQVVEI